MQVNPNPPNVDASGRGVGLKETKHEPNAPYGAGADRNLTIDGVLLNSTNDSDQFNAISQQLQNTYAAANRGGPPEPRYAASKPQVGSDEWYKVRKDNHKEVERRRRETINKGIDELASVVPDCDKHKGQILSKAVDYIKNLKENEQKYLEKLTLEKLLAEQAIQELSNSNKVVKAELEQAWKEVEHWKQQALKKN